MKSIEPVFIISPIGRTGTTMLANILSKHSEIVMDDEYPYENFIANYFIKLYKVVSKFGKFDIYPKYGANPMLIGPYPDNLKNETKKFLYQNLLLDFKFYIKKMILDYYYDVSLLQGKKNTKYFVEKIGYFLVKDAIEIFDKIKILILIRNPIDLYESIKKFNLKRGTKDFRVQNYNNYKEYLVDFFIPTLDKFFKFVETLNDEMYLLIKYEDLIKNTNVIMQNVYMYLDIKTDLIQIDNFSEHKTQEMPSQITRGEKKYYNIL